MPSRPLIAVTTSEVRQATGVAALTSSDPPRREMVLGLTYIRAISAAGGAPVVVPPLDPEQLDAVLDAADGVCLTGGPDVHPSAYGAEPDPDLGPTDADLDATELELARSAYERGLPILAICRGSQLLNVALGGTLHQHLPSIAAPPPAPAVLHRQTDPAHQPTHTVSLLSGSGLAATLETEELRVNSFHHQAVDRLAPGLRASAWAADGTVEGYEAPTRPFLLAVQWHAELLAHRRPDQRLFEALVAASTHAPSSDTARLEVAQ